MTVMISNDSGTISIYGSCKFPNGQIKPADLNDTINYICTIVDNGY